MGSVFSHVFNQHQLPNKTEVYSVQLGKTLGLTKVPIAETEESTQVRKKFGLNYFDQKVKVKVIIKEGQSFGV